MTTAPAAPRIVYASFATTRRSGGVHVMMQHVRLLRQAGLAAALWLPGSLPAPPWFDDDVPVLAGSTLALEADDLLVLPEAPVVPGHDPAPGARKVIFNQNHFYTFAAGDPTGWDYPGWTPVPAVWTVSAEGSDVLTAALADLRVELVPNFVDAELFAPGDRSRPIVAWFARKRPREARLLHRLLAADPRLAGVELRAITDESWTDVAAILGTATVFVSLGHTEGFGLPVAEALAAGCLVAGYDGGGGHELFDAPGAWPIAEQRPLLLVDRVADLIARAPELSGFGPANRTWWLDRYNEDRTRTALLAAVDTARSGPGTAATAVHPAAWLDVLDPYFHLMG